MVLVLGRTSQHSTPDCRIRPQADLGHCHMQSPSASWQCSASAAHHRPIGRVRSTPWIDVPLWRKKRLQFCGWAPSTSLFAREALTCSLYGSLCSVTRPYPPKRDGRVKPRVTRRKERLLRDVALHLRAFGGLPAIKSGAGSLPRKRGRGEEGQAGAAYLILPDSHEHTAAGIAPIAAIRSGLPRAGQRHYARSAQP